MGGVTVRDLLLPSQGGIETTPENLATWQATIKMSASVHGAGWTIRVARPPDCARPECPRSNDRTRSDRIRYPCRVHSPCRCPHGVHRPAPRRPRRKPSLAARGAYLADVSIRAT